VAPLTPEERLEYLYLLERRAGGDSLLDFIPRANPGYLRPTHLKPAADMMARAVQGQKVRGAVSIPPRHSKTESLVVYGVPWYLQQAPHKHVAYITHGDVLAKDKSALARDVARSIGIRLREDTDNKSHWLTPQGGGFLATSIGGRLIGYGFDLLIIDDPYKSRADAESACSPARRSSSSCSAGTPTTWWAC
jgi:hypothetical protein